MVRVRVKAPGQFRGDGLPVAGAARRRLEREAEQWVRVAKLLDELDE
jgi:hypothetical protein